MIVMSMREALEEMATLRGKLDPLLYECLLERLKHADWYLTGIVVGLESLDRFLEIAELAYREYAPDSEGGRRVARLRTVNASLHRFADSAVVAQRAEILVTVRAPLGSLVRDLAIGGDGDGRKRKKSFIAQLAGDVHLGVMRIRTLEQLQDDLGAFEGFLSRTFGGRRPIEDFVQRYRPFAKMLGFEDADVLGRPEGLRAVSDNAEREIGRVHRHLQLLHARIYSGRLRDLSKGGFDIDLEEIQLMTLLAKLAKDGHDYLTRASGIFADALDLIGRSGETLARAEQLEAMLEGNVAELPVKSAAAITTSIPRPSPTPAPAPSVRDLLANAEPGDFLGAPEDEPGAEAALVLGTILLEEVVNESEDPLSRSAVNTRVIALDTSAVAASPPRHEDEAVREMKAAAGAIDDAPTPALSPAGTEPTTLSLLTTLSPDELRALVVQLVRAGKVTKDDIDAAKQNV